MKCPTIEGERVERKGPEYAHEIERGDIHISVRERSLTHDEKTAHKITDETPVHIVLSLADGSTFYVSGHLATYGSQLPIDRDELDAIHREQRIDGHRNEKNAA